MLQEVDLGRAYRTTPTGLYLFSTWANGKRNVQFAFRAIGLDEQPPLLLVGVLNDNYSQGLIRETSEFVLNVCSRAQAPAIDASRGLSGRDVEDKFAALGFETLPAKHVKAPLVAGCHANVECRVLHSLPLDNLILFVAQALACYVDEERAPLARLAGKTFTLQPLA